MERIKSLELHLRTLGRDNLDDLIRFIPISRHIYSSSHPIKRRFNKVPEKQRYLLLDKKKEYRMELIQSVGYSTLTLRQHPTKKYKTFGSKRCLVPPINRLSSLDAPVCSGTQVNIRTYVHIQAAFVVPNKKMDGLPQNGPMADGRPDPIQVKSR